MPRLGKCTYVRQWVAVKIRWSLKVNTAEKRALLARASHCTNDVITVRRAAINTSTSTSGTTSGATGGATSGGNTDPRFSYCYQAIAAGYGPYVRGRDPEYAWYTDSDSDGRVCES